MLITFTQAPVTGGHQMGSFESRTWRGICGLEMVVAFMSCQKKKKKEKPDSRKEKFFISVHCNHCAKTLYITSLCKNYRVPCGSQTLKEDSTVPAHCATQPWTAEGYALVCHFTPSPRLSAGQAQHLQLDRCYGHGVC